MNSSQQRHRPTTLRFWHASASVDQPGKIEQQCEQWLGADEIQRANRFRQLTSRNQHVVGRGMARRLLGESTVAPEEIQFGQHQFGKPFVAAPEAAKQPFNIAHTSGLVVCGVGERAHELVGVDVEPLQRNTDPGLAERYFSKPEIEYLNRIRHQESRQIAFLRIWTLKESFIKAIGTGLQTPLADFAFTNINSLRPQIEILSDDLRDQRTWSFFSFSPRPKFIAATAVATKSEVSLQLNCFDDLIEP